jgi:two-component system, chemotaxis family, chemotaxis protein CheY
MPLNVLIVDDSAALRKIMQRVLRQSELPLGNLYEAGDGVQALEAMKANPVDLVLSDINMPNMDGLQLLAEIRAYSKWHHVRVIMITTEGNQARVMEAVGLGAAGYVRKPFTADQIKEKLLSLT